MTTVSTTPQQIRDRLLQAIDSQSNICNMVIVLEVINCLEKYPITKEALEETRLGKLINDIRKKTKDEDLAKRAKKLLKNWQKLIEPGPVVAPSVTGSTNGSSHLCRTDPSPPEISVLGKGFADVRMRNYVQNTYSPKAEKSSKRKVEHSRLHLTENLSKTSTYDNSVSPLPTNGIAGSPRTQFEQDVTVSPGKCRVDHLDDDRVNRTSVNSVRPCPNSPGVEKLPSTSSLVKVAVIQQHARLEEEGGSYNQGKSPRSVTSSPRSQKHDSLPKRSVPYGLKGTPIPSPSSRDSPLSFSQALASPGQPSFAEKLPHLSHKPLSHTTSLYEPQDVSGTLDSPSASPLLCQQNTESQRSRLEAGFVVSDDTDRMTAANSEHKRRKYKSRDFSINLDGQKVEDTTKRVRLKERRLTFDPVTGQIKPLVHKDPSPVEVSSTPDPAEFRQRTESSVQQSAATTTSPCPNPFLQTNWKELSRNEIIQSYLNLQSNLLTSSGVQTPSAHFFMSEYLKREEQETKESKKMHVLQTDSSKGDLPGMSRQLTDKDLERIHTQQWPGVNGCYDTNGTWYAWTECISLDPHGDENKLNILPYVCLD
ncbi:mediator of RNA polymerase II transcription subunit 26 [Oryzias latipes]|uniref:Mediator of RNA polymerase II transcription subunit 26 n=1 Tax=Oryzias latipes TaxID=8090 RepID=A0A3B3I485_ORYLA|nr:mediator of RNA polymerase II transcription subunit 26 [Oryzias latipes]